MCVCVWMQIQSDVRCLKGQYILNIHINIIMFALYLKNPVFNSNLG